MRASRAVWILLLLPLLVAWRWPGELNRLCRRATEDYKSGRLDDAARQFGEALAEHPGSAELAYDLGTTRLRQDDHAKAVEAFGRALELARTDPLKEQAHYNRGNAYFRLGKIAEAASEYKQALDLDPHDADAEYNYQLCLDLLKKQNPQQQEQGKDKGDQGNQGDQQQDQQGGGDQQQNQDQQQQQQNESQEPQGQQGQGGQNQSTGDSSGNQGKSDNGTGMSEAEVDEILRQLERDERELRAYFQPRSSAGGTNDPWNAFFDLDKRLRDLDGSGNERDW